MAAAETAAAGARATFPHRYHRFVARLFGIRITVIGKPVTGEGVLLVANHTSWLDIVIFSAVAPLSFVAKAEVATLAVLRHPGAAAAHRLRRARAPQRHRRARDAIRERLLAGDALVLFPEGTSP